jgi:protein TonB
MPDAMAAVEQAINARQLDEAERELRLLREADSSNFTLSLLAGKLDAQRMIVVREDEARAAAIRARQEASL